MHLPFFVLSSCPLIQGIFQTFDDTDIPQFAFSLFISPLSSTLVYCRNSILYVGFGCHKPKRVWWTQSTAQTFLYFVKPPGRFCLLLLPSIRFTKMFYFRWIMTETHSKLHDCSADDSQLAISTAESAKQFRLPMPFTAFCATCCIEVYTVVSLTSKVYH